MGYVDLGSLTWDKSTAYNNRFTALLSDMKQYETNIRGNAICNKYVNLSFDDSVVTDKSISCFRGTGGSRVGITDSTYGSSTAEQFKTAMNGTQFVYELATPITVQLTPTQIAQLNGNNNVYADCGDVNELKYYANANLS